MTPDRLRQIEDLCRAAKGRNATGRAALLDGVDAEVRAQVEARLAAVHDEATATVFPVPHAREILAPGTRLGHYAIRKPLSSGGMGAVYEATDERLGRAVAIKVILAERQTADSRKRFAREAQAASALNHPNIVTVHQVGCEGAGENAIDYIVMERIDGQTLRAAIGKTGIPLRTAIAYASQIADALAAAHDAGVVHRDLKPGNIMVTSRGLVKVVDFGLAIRPDAPDGDTSLTRPGQMVGTVAYMSPEQAQGRPVDARSDIFSFGSVLTEMLTGQHAFEQASIAGTLAAILEHEPHLPAPPAIPQSLHRILTRCLRKNPAERWQHMADVKQLVDDVARDVESPAVAPAGAPAKRAKWPALAAASVAGALVTAGAMYWALGLKPAVPETASALLRMVTADGGLTSYPALARDGKLLAFASDRAKEGSLDIWVQAIGGRDPIRLTRDPSDESDPAISPDGTVIAFRSEKEGGGVYVVPALGGMPALLAQRGRNPRFSPDGKWVAYSSGGQAASNPGSAGVFIVAAGGGVPRAIHPEMATATNPVWSPRGDELLVLGRRDGKAPAAREIDWWVLPVDGGTPRRTGVYARFQRQKFGQTQLIRALPTPMEWRPDDRVVFAAALGEATNLWEIPINRAAAMASRLTMGPGIHQHAALSADGAKLAFAAEDLNFDLWMQPLDQRTGAASGEPQRLTEDAIDELAPSASWDGSKIAFISRLSASWSLRLRNLATGGEQSLFSSSSRLRGASLSGDGTRIALSNDAYDLITLPAAGGSAENLCDHCGQVMGLSPDGREVLYEPLEEEDLLAYSAARHATEKVAGRPSAEYILSSSRYSPDGKWVAFHALHNATNTARIWIVPAGPNRPAPAAEWRAITDGSKLERDPAWSGDGRFLYFVSERDGSRCIWARALDAVSKRPAGEAFAVRHFHSARLSLRHVGRLGYLTGLSAAGGKLVYSLGELKGNIWLEEHE